MIGQEELYNALVELREIEGDFEKGYAGAPLFCRVEGIGPEELLKVITIDLSKEGTNVKFNEGATQWCNEQLENKNVH